MKGGDREFRRPERQRCLLDPEPGKDGSPGMNRIQDVLLDPLKEGGIKLSGNLFDQVTGLDG